MQGVSTCSFVLNLDERIKGEIRSDQFVAKVRAHPYMAYIYSVTPNPGAEAILVKGKNNNKAVVNPNRFAIPTLNLSPYHSLLRKNHQYTLWHFGFNFITDVLQGYKIKYKNAFYTMLQLEPEGPDEEKYYKLVIDNKSFGYENYTVREGESLVTISEKLLVNDYMILEANPAVHNYDDVKPGQVIRVPNSFGKKVVLLVDRITFLPMVQTVYDDKGLYGRVVYTSFVLNPVFTDADFSRYNKKYGF